MEARILQDIADLGLDDSRRIELGICAMSIMQVVNDYPSYAINIWSAVVDCAKKTKLEEAKKHSNKVWVAVKELILRYYIGETLLFTIFIPIMVT